MTVPLCVAADDVVDLAARHVPQVGVLGDPRSVRGRASADENRRVGPPDGLGVAERPGEPVGGGVEGEGSRSVHSRRITVHAETRHGVHGVVEGRPVRRVLAPGQRMGGSGREPMSRSTVVVILAGGGGRPEPIAGHHDAEPQPSGLNVERRERLQPSKTGPSGSLA
ncbi:hypothetical protein ACIQGO_05975 [Streptomyces shenzhenensis]|uniref:hypothetical protein n=1 Tax=Streptomyces shenzhenensis TaxID=943815 RepID=UPI00381BDEF0